MAIGLAYNIKEGLKLRHGFWSVRRGELIFLFLENLGCYDISFSQCWESVKARCAGGRNLCRGGQGFGMRLIYNALFFWLIAV